MTPAEIIPVPTWRREQPRSRRNVIRPAIVRPGALLLSAVVLVAACSDGGEGADESPASAPTVVPIMSAPDAPRPTSSADAAATATTEATTEGTERDGAMPATSFTVRPGSGQVAVVGADPGEELALIGGGAVDDGAGAGRAD